MSKLYITAIKYLDPWPSNNVDVVADAVEVRNFANARIIAEKYKADYYHVHRWNGTSKGFFKKTVNGKWEYIQGDRHE